jgi:hypothetical protein
MDRRSFLMSLLAARATRNLARAQAAPRRGPIFEDVTARAGIKFQCNGSPTPQKYLIETMPGGVAMLDYDGDGYQDLYFVNGAKLFDSMPPGRKPDKSDPAFWNRLYHNNGDGTFTDVTEKAGLRGDAYGMGVAVGDYNNDGYPDLYVTNFGRNTLYRNNGDGTFTDVTEKAGVGGGGWSSSACFVDYDRDGFLDLIVTRYMEWDFDKNIWCGPRDPAYRGYCHPESFKKATHLVFHNNGDGTFTDVSKECGIGKVPGYGLGIAFNDYDGDGWPDILIANDNVPEQLFHNLRNGKFEEVALGAGLAYDEDGRTFSGMGTDFNDYDNDGWPDVIVGALANEKYALFKNRKGAFEYASGVSGLARISAQHSGWGLKLIDYDNDGWKDLFVAQSHVMDNIELSSPSLRYMEPMLMLKNTRGVFTDVSAQSGEALAVPRASRGVAFGDLDNDGFPDIAASCLNGPAVVLRNSGGTGYHWLLVDTVGTVSNRDGMGARLRVVSESGFEQFGYVSTAGSYQSANDKRVHFGLGTDKKIKLLEVLWPSGIKQTLEDVPVDRVLKVKEPQGEAKQPGAPR